jgi:hypothetical protein
MTVHYSLLGQIASRLSVYARGQGTVAPHSSPSGAILENLAGSNPYFSAGFGFMGVGVGLAILRGSVGFSSHEVRLRMLVTLKIANRNKLFESLCSTHRSVSTATCTAREFLSCSLSPYVLPSTWICQRTELRSERYLEFGMHVDSGKVRVYFPCKHPTSLELSCRATAVVAASSGSCMVQLCLITFHLSPCDSSSPLPIYNA